MPEIMLTRMLFEPNMKNYSLRFISIFNYYYNLRLSSKHDHNPVNK
jgi:hypothetical protein